MTVAAASVPADWRDFLALTKPRVMTLVVFTGLCGLLAAPTHVDPVIGFTAILCIALGAGAAGALNMWYEADLDAVMKRTAGRPLPAGRMDRPAALQFGVGLGAFAVILMGLAVNLAAGFILAVSILFYVLVYTVWLKRRTPQNIVIGGAAADRALHAADGAGGAAALAAGAGRPRLWLDRARHHRAVRGDGGAGGDAAHRSTRPHDPGEALVPLFDPLPLRGVRRAGRRPAGTGMRRDPFKDDREDLVRRRQKGRALVMAVLLGGLALLIFAITLAKIRLGMVH